MLSPLSYRDMGRAYHPSARPTTGLRTDWRTSGRISCLPRCIIPDITGPNVTGTGTPTRYRTEVTALGVHLSTEVVVEVANVGAVGVRLARFVGPRPGGICSTVEEVVLDQNVIDLAEVAVEREGRRGAGATHVEAVVANGDVGSTVVANGCQMVTRIASSVAVDPGILDQGVIFQSDAGFEVVDVDATDGDVGQADHCSGAVSSSVEFAVLNGETESAAQIAVIQGTGASLAVVNARLHELGVADDDIVGPDGQAAGDQLSVDDCARSSD